MTNKTCKSDECNAKLITKEENEVGYCAICYRAFQFGQESDLVYGSAISRPYCSLCDDRRSTMVVKPNIFMCDACYDNPKGIVNVT